jgi:hypothetical protein
VKRGFVILFNLIDYNLTNLKSNRKAIAVSIIDNTKIVSNLLFSFIVSFFKVASISFRCSSVSILVSMMLGFELPMLVCLFLKKLFLFLRFEFSLSRLIMSNTCVPPAITLLFC